MGGQLWKEEEEEYFWKEVVPRSDKKLGYETDEEKATDWKELAAEMQEAMDVKFRAMGKEGAPRKYTHLTLMEHWDKNVMQDRVSKGARPYVERYVHRMPKTDPKRWEKRQTRLGNLASGGVGEDGEPKKKRKRASGVSTIGRTPSTTGRSTPAAEPTSKRRRIVAAHDDTEDEDDGDEDDKLRRSASGRVLPSIQNLLRGVPSGPDTTRRQLFPLAPSGRTIAGNDPRTLPRPGHIIDRSDNPYRPRLEAPVAAVPDLRGAVQDEMDRHVPAIDGMVADNLRRVVRAEVANNIGTIAHDEVARGLDAVVRDEVARQLPRLVREEVARQFPTLIRDEVARQLAASLQHNPAPVMDQSDMETIRRAEEIYLPAPRATVPSSAHYPQQQFQSVGRGGPSFSRQPPTGQTSPSPQPAAARGTRTPLPTGRPGQFPTSDVRSRARGRHSDNPADDQQQEEEEKDGEGEDRRA